MPLENVVILNQNGNKQQVYVPNHHNKSNFHQGPPKETPPIKGKVDLNMIMDMLRQMNSKVDNLEQETVFLKQNLNRPQVSPQTQLWTR